MEPGTSDLQFACDWRLAFNVHPGKKAPIGYLLSWSGLGGLNLSTDIEVFHPLGSGTDVVPGPTVTCVGVLESLIFRSAYDPITVSAFISREGAANVRAKLSNPLTSNSVQCEWAIIDYDTDRKCWYDAAYVQDGASLDGNVDSQDGEQMIAIDPVSESLSDTLDISVFRFRFQIVPSPGQTTNLEFATGPTIKLVRAWGDDST